MAGAAERRHDRRPVLAVALLAALAASALVAVARAEAPSGHYKPTLDATVRFLQEDQNEDGGFGGEPGSPSDPDISAWVALALAAASVNPHDQKKPGETDAYTYLAEHAGELKTTTDFERELMVVNTAEYPPQPLGGVDLVARLLESRLPSGAFTHEVGGVNPGMNDTIFAILALAPIKEPAIEANVREAAEWVSREQNTDGSWPSWCPKSVCGRGGKDPQGSTDMTGAALEALNAAGMNDTEAQALALVYLHEAQLPNGGWPQAIGETESNVGSTAWVSQGIWASGGNPENWIVDGNEPLGYMASLQQEDGHIRYMKSHEMNGVWMTAYATPAFAGQALPIGLVPRAHPEEPAPTEKPKGSEEPTAATTPPVSPTNSGGGSGGFQQGEGVIAGGGGDGAPLFSRPKPQSPGKTPGGARVVRRQKLEAKDHSHNRRGANVHQARGTERFEPLAREADQSAPSVSSTATTGGGGKGGAGGGGGDEGNGPGERGAPLPVEGAPREAGTTSGEEVSGTVIGSPDGTKGKLAFGAPGLKGAGDGASDGLGAAIAIGVAALLAAAVGAGWEQRRGRLA
ncbi:MAG TPA: prenyltransferase/squalene oxidase repeat-containing protein [Solirubrobacterales bacterium]|nr:prenyltransferase/squalene oxidase repeat-containing protein [Solirubrobacterales bacterium]